MRHAASLLAAMEGISRPAFRIARELANNSRAGLTTRFLSKKLDIPEEEVEYLVDVNHRFLYTDLTKIKIPPEGVNVVRRIIRGLENHGDIPSLLRAVKALGPHEFRNLEELAGIDGPCAKKALGEEVAHRCYHHPDSVVTYVATRNFSAKAREVFDLIWQSPEGIMPVSKIRALAKASEYEVEQALSELFDGLALFEMFRFDAEDRLVRVAALLSEIRQFREETEKQRGQKARLKPFRGTPSGIVSYGLDFSDMVCRLVAAIAAKPVRLRGDGDLFREDRRRLEEICPEDSEPALNACLWVSQGIGWLARVDNELRAGDLEPLLKLSRLERHRLLCDWLLSTEHETFPRRLLSTLVEEMKPGAWYPTLEVVRHATTLQAEDEQPVLKCSGNHWQYVGASALQHSERALVRAFEETLPWLGLVNRAEEDGDSLVAVTEFGERYLNGKPFDDLAPKFPQRKADIIVQPNFDIVVPTQDTDPLVTVPLDQFGERASTGKATVYHLTKESFTKSVQDGHDGEAFIAFLLEHNRGGALPANVLTTLRDWRGGMKRVRLRTLQVIESEDPLVMADLLHRRRFKKHLTTVDPQRQAVYGGINRTDLAKELEKDGFIVD